MTKFNVRVRFEVQMDCRINAESEGEALEYLSTVASHYAPIPHGIITTLQRDGNTTASFNSPVQDSMSVCIIKYEPDVDEVNEVKQKTISSMMRDELLASIEDAKTPEAHGEAINDLANYDARNGVNP